MQSYINSLTKIG